MRESKLTTRSRIRRSRTAVVVDDGEHQLSSRGELPVYCRLSVPDPNSTAHLSDLDLESQDVPRYDLPFEAHAVDPGEECELAAVLLHTQERHRTDLSQGFDDQHAGHNRMVGKMTLKKGVAHGDVLDADCPLAVFDLDDSINEQERIAVRNDLLNLSSIKQSALLSGVNGGGNVESFGV